MLQTQSKDTTQESTKGQPQPLTTTLPYFFSLLFFGYIYMILSFFVFCFLLFYVYPHNYKVAFLQNVQRLMAKIQISVGTDEAKD